MIPASTDRRQTSANWQQQLAAGHRRPLELLADPGLALQRLDRAGFVADPVAVSPAQRAPGLLQKYAGRALLIATGACARLRASGATMVNQFVLLAGVNDNAEVLATLSRRLFDCAVLPCYLHLPDPVRGAAHFDVSETRARRLMTELARTLRGYLLPRLVR